MKGCLFFMGGGAAGCSHSRGRGSDFLSVKRSSEPPQLHNAALHPEVCGRAPTQELPAERLNPSITGRGGGGAATPCQRARVRAQHHEGWGELFAPQRPRLQPQFSVIRVNN